MSVFDVIKARRSVPRLRPDPVPQEIIERMLEAAVWAPNHRMTEPWRFFVLAGEGKRRFAEIRRRLRAAGFADPSAPEAVRALDRLTEDTLATPAVIAVTARQAGDEEQREDDAAATFMAMQNIMLVATEAGVGTYLRTGAILRDPALRELLSLEEDRRILGVIFVGYPAEIPQKRRAPAQERTVWL